MHSLICPLHSLDGEYEFIHSIMLEERGANWLEVETYSGD